MEVTAAVRIEANIWRPVRRAFHSFDPKAALYMDIKGFLADHTGHFSPYDIPGLIFMMLVAAVITWIVAVFGGRLRGNEPRQLALWSASMALAVAFVKMQLPLAIALVALALIVRPAFKTTRDQLLLFAALVIGFGCGSGASLIMAVAVIPYLLIVRWAIPAAIDHEDR